MAAKFLPGAGKRPLYRTAKATIGCAHFTAGEFVAIQYDGQRAINGIHWYLVTRSERGPIDQRVAYPEHHLTDFCL